MAKITLTDIASGYNSYSTYNANNTLIEAAIENTLSRDGTSPNTMSALLDMNSNRIVNLPNASNNSEPVTLGQAASIQSFTGVVATAGSVGAVLWPQTAAELAAAVTPVNYEYEPGNVLRYGDNSTPGTTDMTTAIQNALDSNMEVFLPVGDYLITSALTLNTDNVLRGAGWDSVIKGSADINMITGTTISGAVVRDLKLEHVTSTSNGRGIEFSGSTDCKVLDCEITGCSGDGVRAGATSSRIEVRGCYFHTFTGSLQDSSDINFYNNCKYSIAANNQCYGGNWHGIKFQLTSYYNTAINNKIGAHTAYGILLTYETTPARTYNKAIGNTIEGITGSALISGQERAGAGIYGVSGGDIVISGNIIKDCNSATTVEVLSPGGIGISGMQGSCVIDSNIIYSCDWYGMAIFTNTDAHIQISNNTIEDCTKHAIYCKDSDHLTITGNTVYNTANTQSGIRVRHQTTTCSDIVIANNNLFGNATTGMGNGIYLLNADEYSVTGNVIKSTTSYGIGIDNSDNGCVTGNTLRDIAGTAAIRTITATNCIINGNHIQGNSTYFYEAAGSSASGVRVTNNYSSPNVANNAQGAFIETRGTASPGSGQWAIGDIRWDETPGAGLYMGWVCTTAGSPGTWKKFGGVETANAWTDGAAHTTLRDTTGTSTAAHALQLIETLITDLKSQGTLQ